MTEPNLLTISVFAFIAVFTLLSVLAIVMQALTMLFPEKADEYDAALLSVVVTAAAAAYPGLRVTHVEEIR
jgi:predicted ABC-type exoprotein transport system permease subunit